MSQTILHVIKHLKTPSSSKNKQLARETDGQTLRQGKNMDRSSTVTTSRIQSLKNKSLVGMKIFFKEISKN